MTLKEYLPLYFQNIREFDKMAEAQQPEINLLKASLKAVENNQFIATLDYAGCSRWEGILGITPMDTATLEDRRFSILTKYQEELPYTWLSLIQRLNTTLGEGNYLITENRASWTLTVRIMLTRKQQLNEITEMLENFVPCPIIIEIKLLYNTHAVLSNYTHGHLADYTHFELREEVIS